MWNAFVQFLADLIRWFYHFTDTIGFPNYGLAIILFTTALRILMFPLNLMQAKSSKAMALVQPKVQKLQQQYKNDQAILNRELQALYKKYNANPLSGCLPMLIQMPVLFALFAALRNFEYIGEGTSFFWLTSMSEPDPTGIILPLIVGFSTYLQTKLSMATQPPANEQTKTMNTVMLYGMPIMLGWMTRGFASGLAIYWSASNILGFLMQIGINAIVIRSSETMKAAIEADEAKAEDDLRREENRKKREAERKKAENKKKAQAARSGHNTKKSSDTRGKELDFDD